MEFYHWFLEAQQNTYLSVYLFFSVGQMCVYVEEDTHQILHTPSYLTFFHDDSLS